uniref:Uncharacterized protein n=1 Tax=Anguilla anguilla TaxID=7936 RepID=A0A0E9T149_ANGAN
MCQQTGVGHYFSSL